MKQCTKCEEYEHKNNLFNCARCDRLFCMDCLVVPTDPKTGKAREDELFRCKRCSKKNYGYGYKNMEEAKAHVKALKKDLKKKAKKYL